MWSRTVRPSPAWVAFVVASLGIASDVRAEEGAPAKQVSSTGSPDALVLAFTGDVSFAGRAPVNAPLADADDPLLPMRQVLDFADLTVINLEGLLTPTDPGPRPGHIALWAPPPFADALVRAGVDVVGTANNHAYDGGGDGVRDTFSTLEASGLTVIGTGPSRERARAAHIHPTPTGCIAIVPATTFVNQPEPAGEARAAHYRARQPLFDRVRGVAARCPFVAVYLHWGQQFVDAPTGDMRRFALRLLEEGADLVVAHHPHVLQGVELRGDAAIAYSLGNFVFPSSRPSTLMTGVLLAQVELSPEPHLAGLELEPAIIDPTTRTPSPAGVRSDEVRDRMARLSRRFGTEVDLVGGRIRFRPRVR